MQIEACAPTRIDLAGGTLDIYPLYVFENGGITVNLAIEFLSYVIIEEREDEKIYLSSKDMGEEKKVKNINNLTFDDNFDLISRAIKFYNPSKGLNVYTHNPVPKGSGLGASSSLLMALSGALNKITGRNYNKKQIIDIGANIEAQSLKIPTGKQDYYAAIYGGLNAIWFNMDGVKVEPLLNKPGLKDFEKMIIISHTGESRFSGTNNWNMMKRYIDCKDKTVEHMKNIKNTSEKMMLALKNGDFEKVAHLINEEWENRKNLAKGVTTDKIDSLMKAAKREGALASKICGAGGGGCMVTITEPSKKSKIIETLKDNGAIIMDIKIASKGLRLIERK